MAKLYFYYAAMNAGKSTTLLQAAFNYHERGMATMLWTSAIDDRERSGWISSRIGLAEPAQVYNGRTDLLRHVIVRLAAGPLACVLVDEAQFLSPEQVWQLAHVADVLSVPVVCYGLRTDFRGDLFPGSATLLGIADSFVELKAVCHCGRKATMNLRVDENGAAIREREQIGIGGNERYVALCRCHFREAII